MVADLKPENLLYLTRDPNSALVLADFGIAKMLNSKDEVLTTMAGSFGYAAPEVMLKKGHGKPVDMWSLGVITYTLLCGYSPFRSESLQDLIEECKVGRIVFHERYWKEVSEEAKDFITHLLQPRPEARATSAVRTFQPLIIPPFRAFLMGTWVFLQEALQHVWLSGKTATDHNLLPEIRQYMAKARLRRGIEIIKLANRIESLKMQSDEEEDDDSHSEGDIPADAKSAAKEAMSGPTGVAGTTYSGDDLSMITTTTTAGSTTSTATTNSSSGAGDKSSARPGNKTRTLSRATRGAIFREIVFAKVREKKELDARRELERTASERNNNNNTGSSQQSLSRSTSNESGY